MNTWPNSIRRALTQAQHNAHNREAYPGTRQLCYFCGEPTERCEEDELTDDDGHPLCSFCAEERLQ